VERTLQKGKSVSLTLLSKHSHWCYKDGMGNHFFFFLGLSFIFTHEMDAIKSREWTIFPLVARLDEKTGYFVFTALHVPLYFLLLWNLYRPTGLNLSLIRGLDIFFIIHIFLHLLLLRHPKNQFKSVFSWVMILGAGVAGSFDLLVAF
jgi:hypothetical protein